MGLGFILVGFAAGLLIGLTGVGGGSLVTPALVLVFGFNPLVAVGTDLLYASATRIIGVLAYGVRGKVRADLVWRLVAGSVPAALLGGVLLRAVPGEVLGRVVTALLGLVLVIVGALGLLDRGVPVPVRPRKRHAFLAGFVVGLLVQFTSIGAGVIVGFALLHIARLDPREVVGTTLLYGLALGGLGLAGYASAGLIDYGAASRLILGTVPGVLLGAGLAGRIDPRRLKKLIYAVLMLVGTGILVGGL